MILFALFIKLKYMLFKRATTEQELNDVFSLRYRVYCFEKGYEKPENYPYGLEIDEYDPYSVHFIGYLGSCPVGTVRLVMSNTNGFPMEKYCNVDSRDFCSDARKVAEISRLAVSSVLSKRLSINKHEFTLSLLRELCNIANQVNISCLLAAMSTGLDRLLNRCGIRFTRIGSPVDYHGVRIPYLAHMEDLKNELYENRRDIFEYFFPLQEYSIK